MKILYGNTTWPPHYIVAVEVGALADGMSAFGTKRTSRAL